jgi:predicted transcriptional regulator
MTAKIADVTKRRDKLVIMAEIMDISRNGALKTQIMYKANLSFSQLKEYLTLLTSAKLLAKTAHNGKEVYKSTPKGKDFLIKQEAIMDLLCGDQADTNKFTCPPAGFLGKTESIKR